MKNKILCVLNTFYNYEHIKLCLDSIWSDKIDFFILENKSDHSELIEEYIKTKKVIGYLQSEENITYKTVNFFFQNYKDLINSYEYFTISDGDLLIDDIDSLYDEMINILEKPNVKVCCVNLKQENLPKITGSESWIPKGRIVDNCYMTFKTGTHMMTFKKENFFIFLELENMLDNLVHKNVESYGGVSAVTIINKSKHLTWDYYLDGNEYYEWKLKNPWVLGLHTKNSTIKKII